MITFTSPFRGRRDVPSCAEQVGGVERQLALVVVEDAVGPDRAADAAGRERRVDVHPDAARVRALARRGRDRVERLRDAAAGGEPDAQAPGRRERGGSGAARPLCSSAPRAASTANAPRRARAAAAERRYSEAWRAAGGRGLPSLFRCTRIARMKQRTRSAGDALTHRSDALRPRSRRRTEGGAVTGRRDRDRRRAGLPGESAVLPLSTQENFSVAARVLGRRTRDHLLAIYGFARLVDQLGDEAAGDRLALLDRLEAELDRVYDGEPEHPLMRTARSRRVRERDLPREPFVRLIAGEPARPGAGALRDLRRPRRLLRRCRRIRSASSCCTSSARRRPSGSRSRTASAPALQLVEHWQDVAEDFAAAAASTCRPRTSSASASTRRRPRRARRPAPALRELMAFEVGRARRAARRGRAARRHAARPRALRGRGLRRRRARERRGDRGAPGTTCSRGRRRRAGRARCARRSSCWRHGR